MRDMQFCDELAMFVSTRDEFSGFQPHRMIEKVSSIKRLIRIDMKNTENR